MNETWSNDRWGRRPRRSASDRKIAGVAGGLGRAIGIDPVVLRVVFVVLAIFGGFGVLLYALGWLLLPADGDEVSAAESLLGRGRSSVPPVLTVGLGLVVLISLGSIFSWGLPFWPVVIASIVVTAVLNKRRRFERIHARAGRFDDRAEHSARVWAERGDRWGQRATEWGDRVEQWVNRQTWAGGCGKSSTTTTEPPSQQPSPFDRPAFWDQHEQAPTWRPAGPDLTKRGPDPSKQGPDLTKHTGPSAPQSAPLSDAPPADALLADRIPPAWDPLGVAPFAWDLPDPAPVAPVEPQRKRGSGPIGRITFGAILLAAGLATAGVFAGWWNLSWAQVSGIALAVLAIGLLTSALRGRGYGLIGPGVFLSLVTVALGFTGLHGTDGFGRTTWSPISASEVQRVYEINAGHGIVDLSKVIVPSGQTVPVTVILRAGAADVELPADTAATVNCEVDAGQVDCLDQRRSGANQTATSSLTGSSATGKIDLTMIVKAGYGQVTHG